MDQSPSTFGAAGEVASDPSEDRGPLHGVPLRPPPDVDPDDLAAALDWLSDDILAAPTIAESHGAVIEKVLAHQATLLALEKVVGHVPLEREYAHTMSFVQGLATGETDDDDRKIEALAVVNGMAILLRVTEGGRPMRQYVLGTRKLMQAALDADELVLARPRVYWDVQTGDRVRYTDPESQETIEGVVAGLRSGHEHGYQVKITAAPLEGSDGGDTVERYVPAGPNLVILAGKDGTPNA